MLRAAPMPLQPLFTATFESVPAARRQKAERCRSSNPVSHQKDKRKQLADSSDFSRSQVAWSSNLVLIYWTSLTPTLMASLRFSLRYSGDTDRTCNTSVVLSSINGTTIRFRGLGLGGTDHREHSKSKPAEWLVVSRSKAEPQPQLQRTANALQEVIQLLFFLRMKFS